MIYDLAMNNTEPKMKQERMYHLFAISEKTNEATQLTKYAMPHHECCVMKSKFSSHPDRRIVLREA